MSKILISYFSASGVTRRKASDLATKLNGDLYEITPKQIYTDDDLNWHNSNSRSSIEIKDKNFRPEIENINIDINSYDTIYYLLYIRWFIIISSNRRFKKNISKLGYRKWKLKI